MRAKKEYEGVIKELKEKLLEYKEKYNLELQRNAQSSLGSAGNEFGFDDEEAARLTIENEQLLKRLRALEEEREGERQAAGKLEAAKQALEGRLQAREAEVKELGAKLEELRRQYVRVELVAENLKKGAGQDRQQSVSLKQWEDLERRYIQTKK